MDKRIEDIANDFCKGQYDYRVEETLWPIVFDFLVQHLDEMTVDKDSVHLLWTVNGGHLRRKVSNDALVLKVLIKVLPGYDGEGLILYRGECQFLYEQNKIGFCWTPKFSVAEMFASGLNSIESGGVLLKAFAPTEAILAKPNKHSSSQMQEFEYTCNPNLLTDIEVVSRFKKN
jgi:hypothetical protein